MPEIFQELKVSFTQKRGIVENEVTTDFSLHEENAPILKIKLPDKAGIPDGSAREFQEGHSTRKAYIDHVRHLTCINEPCR